MGADGVTRFRAFGLCIETAFPPERWFGTAVARLLHPAEGSPDVEIRVRTSRAWAGEQNPEPTPDRLVLQVEGVARFDVSGGHTIIVDTEADGDDARVGVYLFGSALGALLHQRRLLPLHASAVQVGDGSCALFVGPSGAGKSTLAAALGRRGWAPFTDDVAAVSLDPGGRPLVSRGLPRLKLPPDAVRYLGDDPSSLARVMPSFDKHSLPLDVCASSPPTLGVSQVWVLNPTPCQTPEVEPLRGARKLAALVDNTYRYCFVRACGMSALHFEQCARLAKLVPVLRLDRPRNGYALDAMINALEAHWARGDT